MNVADGLIAATSRQLTRRTVAWGGGLLITVIVAMAAFDIVRSYQATVEDTGRELETQARIISEEMGRSVQVGRCRAAAHPRLNLTAAVCLS